MLAFASCRVDANPMLFNRGRLSFVLRGIPNGDTHHLEVCTEEEIAPVERRLNFSASLVG